MSVLPHNALNHLSDKHNLCHMYVHAQTKCERGCLHSKIEGEVLSVSEPYYTHYLSEIATVSLNLSIGEINKLQYQHQTIQSNLYVLSHDSPFTQQSSIGIQYRIIFGSFQRCTIRTKVAYPLQSIHISLGVNIGQIILKCTGKFLRIREVETADAPMHIAR